MNNAYLGRYVYILTCTVVSRLFPIKILLVYNHVSCAFTETITTISQWVNKVSVKKKKQRGIVVYCMSQAKCLKFEWLIH